MAIIGDAFIQIKPETSDFEQQTEQGVGGALTSVAKKAAVAAGAFVAFGQGASFLKGAVTSASDLGESLSKINVVFGDSAAEVIKFTEGAAEGLGQTQAQAAEAVGTFGNLLRAVGLTSDQSAQFSTDMVKLAGDLASFNNADPTEVLDALRAGLVGEAEPLKRFGVNINAARIEAKALELGLVGVDGAMTDAAKTQATYALIMEDTKLAQGDFARTSDGLANQQRILAARFGDLQAKIGQAFLPIVTKVVSFLAGPGIAAFESIARTIGNVASAIGGALGPAFSRVLDFGKGLVSNFQGPGNQIAGIAVEIGKAFGWTEDSSQVDFLATAFERVYSVLRTIVVDGFGALRTAASTAFEFITGTAIPAAQAAIGSFIDGLRGTGGEGSFFVDLGEAVRRVYDIISDLIPKVRDIIVRVFDTIRENRAVAIGLGVAFAALVAPVATLVAGFIVLYQRSELFRDIVAGVISTVQSAIGIIVDLARIIGEALTPVIEFLAGQIGELVTFFVDNWAQIRQAVENAVIAIAAVIAVVIAPIVIFFRSWGDEILGIIGAVWAQVQNIISTAVELIKGIIQVFISVLTGDWSGAWEGIKNILAASIGFIVDSIKNLGTIILNLISGIVGGLADLWRTGWQTLFNIMEGLAGTITGRVSGFVGEVVGYFVGIPGQLLGLVGSFTSAAASLGSALIDGLKGALSGAVGFAGDIAQALRRAINNTVLIPLRNALTFTIDIPGPFGSFTVNGGSLIPLLAKGGIALGPTLAGIGEAGREAVIPLPPGLLEGLQSLARDQLSGRARLGGGGDVELNVSMVFPSVTDESAARGITRAVDDNLATGALMRRLELGARS